MAQKDQEPKEQSRPVTLAQVIKHIERVPGYVGVDRKEALRQTFEHWAETNALVRDVRDGMTTFSAEYERVFGAYDGVAAWYPHMCAPKTSRTLELAVGNTAFSETADVLIYTPPCLHSSEQGSLEGQ